MFGFSLGVVDPSVLRKKETEPFLQYELTWPIPWQNILRRWMMRTGVSERMLQSLWANLAILGAFNR
jgi:hypothetical protein